MAVGLRLDDQRAELRLAEGAPLKGTSWAPMLILRGGASFRSRGRVFSLAMGCLDRDRTCGITEHRTAAGRLVAEYSWPCPAAAYFQAMGKTRRGADPDRLAVLRGRIEGAAASSESRPYWSTTPVVLDEPLWAIAFCHSAGGAWIAWYRTATRNLDRAVAEARRFSGASADAEPSVLPTVPRSDSYRGEDQMLTAIPVGHPDATGMSDQLQDAMRLLTAAEEEGRYLGPLTIDLPVAHEIDDLRCGKSRKVKTVFWRDHGGTGRSGTDTRQRDGRRSALGRATRV